MAIRNIPNIVGPSFGGFIYGLTFQNGFSSTPSRLTISIINETGEYQDPVLNSAATISIGDIFKFNGYIYEFNNDKRQNGQKILEVTLIDQSIILQRINVTLFKRGILGLTGSSYTATKQITVNNPNPQITVQPDGSYAVLINPETKQVPISRTLQTIAKGNFDLKKGGYIIIGKEIFTDSPPNCEIPNVQYNFTMLKEATGNLLDGMPDIQPLYYNTYEGKLSDVLSSWCADFGFSYTWDFNKNKLFFIDLRQGIPTVPDLEDCEVLSKSTSKTLDGSFKQYGVAVYAKPKNKFNSANTSTTTYTPYSFGPFDVDFLVGGGSTGYGGNRTKTQFISSCILSYYNSALRKIYNAHFTDEFGQFNEVLGIKSLTTRINKTSIEPFLLSTNPNLSESFEKYQGNYGVYLAVYDSSEESKWEKLESDIASNFIGKYYRGLSVENSVIRYCTNDLIYNYSYSVTPQGTDFDGKSNGPLPFQNLILTNYTPTSSIYKIFTRSGGFSHSTQQFDQALGIENYSQSDLLDWNFQILPLAGANLQNFPSSIKKQLNLSDEQLRTYSLIIFPTYDQVKKVLQINFNPYRGRNRSESAVLQSTKPSSNCQFVGSELLCKSAEEEAREIAYPNQSNSSATPPQIGLLSTVGYGLTISLAGKSVSVVAPADGSYQGYIEIDESIEVLLKKENIYQSYGNIEDGDGVAEIRVSVNNITDNFFEDEQTRGLTELDVVNALTSKSVVPRKVIKYTASDFQNNLPLSVENGLESLDITANDQGLDISYTYGNKPKVSPPLDVQLRNVQSQFNRTTFAAQ